MTVSHRPANDLDLKSLVHYEGETLWRNVATASFPAAAVLFGIIYAKWRSVLAASLVAVGLFLASALSNMRFFRDIKRRGRLKTDENAVEVFDVSVARVIEIEPLGDDAPALCFFVGDGKALLLVGQWLLEYDEFPAESFRLHRWADSKTPIRMEVTGPTVSAVRSSVRLLPKYRFGKIEVVDATLETLQHGLERAFA